MRYAKKTLERLNRLHADRCNKEPHRSHLGASTLGTSCDRRVWYGWRWAAREVVSGQIARLFGRGHFEEPRFLEYLRDLGAEVWDVNPDTGRQFQITFAGPHGGGSTDAVARGGISELPDNDPYLVECKTHNNKSFEALVDQGVMGSKFEHFIQAQLYMHGLGLKWCLYMAVNKDNDELHLEVIQYDEDFARKQVERAEGIVAMTNPPAKINDKPSWFACRYCPAKDVCHNDKPPERNCRTCREARATDAGWVCAAKQKAIDTDPHKGCARYKRAF